MLFPRFAPAARQGVSFLRRCGTPQNHALLMGLLGGMYALVAVHQFLATFGTGLAAVTALAVAAAVGVESGWKPALLSEKPAGRRWGRSSPGHLVAAVWVLLLPWGLEAAMQLAGRVPLEVMAIPGRLVLFELLAGVGLLSPLFFWLARCPLSSCALLFAQPAFPAEDKREKQMNATGERRPHRAARQPGGELLLLLRKPARHLGQWWRNRRHNARQRSGPEKILSHYAAGLIAGITGTVLVLAPWVGLQVPVMVAAVAGTGLFLYGLFREFSLSPASQHVFSGERSGKRAGTVSTGGASSVTSSGRERAVAADSSSVAPSSARKPFERFSAAIVRGVLVAGIGGTTAIAARMLQQLAPVDVYVVSFQMTALLAGGLWGMQAGRRRVCRTADDAFSWFAAVWWVSGAAAALLLFFPALIAVSLWLNVYVTVPWLMMVARGALMAVFLLPMGYGWGRLLSARWISRPRNAANNRQAAEVRQAAECNTGANKDTGNKDIGNKDIGRESGHLGPAGWPALQMFPFFAGYLLVRWSVLPDADPATALTALQWGLLGVVGTGFGVRHWQNLRQFFRPESRRRRSCTVENGKGPIAVSVSSSSRGKLPGAGSPADTSFVSSGWFLRHSRVAVLAVGVVAVLAMPWAHSRYQPSQAARQLFATNVFVAKMKGLDASLLPFLDEGRLVAQREGETGTLTLWRYRGTQLQIRKNGVPQALVSTRPALCPQFSAEVMPAVLPLVLHPRPHRVLLLGLSGGVSLTTTLSFPVKSVTCVEEDPRLIQLLREKVWSESRERPETDLRLRLLRLPPVMAVACAGSQFDVIISTPPPSMLLQASGQFTRGFYRRLAGRLSPDGIFCQRFHQVDYGPLPLQTTAKTLQSVFRYVAAIEIAGGEMALLATNSPQGLVRDGLLDRFQAPHVRTVLSRLGWDWSLPLNLTAFSQDGLKQMAAAASVSANTAANGCLSFRLPQEVIRWAPKWQEMLAATAPYRTRFLEAEGIDGNNPVLLRRLAELTGQRKLMLTYPDQWWAYRKSLKRQLKERPRTLMTSVASGRRGRIHPEDRRRLSYFRQLARAAEHPTPDAIRRVAAFAQPYDPLLSYFVHQEVAALYERSTPPDWRAELWHRLHAIYYAHPRDRSVRDVSRALLLLSHHPDVLSRPADRWDHLNALLQILKTRWTTRGLVAPRSPQIVLNDIDDSLEAVEAALLALGELREAVGFSAAEWNARKRVLEQGLRRPLRDYRARLLKRHRYERHRIRDLLKRLEEDSRPQTKPANGTDSSPPASPVVPLHPSAN